MKLKKEKEALQMFCADAGFITKYDSPFINPDDNGRLWATDSKILITLDTTYTRGKYEERQCPKLQVVPNCDRLLKFDDILEVVESFKTEKEIKVVGSRNIDCPNCGGEGSVTWTHIDCEGETHEMDYDCPWCDGTGWITEDVEEETGRLLLPKKSRIDIDGVLFEAQRFTLAIKAMKKMGFSEMRYLMRAEHKANAFQVHDGVLFFISPSSVEREELIINI